MKIGVAINNNQDVGRDPTSLGISVGIETLFPDFGETTAMGSEPLSGSVDELANAFQAYEQAGGSQLIIHHSPTSLAGLERVADAVRVYRSL